MPLFPLEEFGTTPSPQADKPVPVQPAPQISEAELEAARLAGYEAGYQAGWDDATKADDNERERIGAEFARNLQDLGFTFHEARSHVMQSLEPLLASMVNKVLPELVSDTIGQAIVEEILPLAADAADCPIEVVTHPAGRATLEEFLSQNISVPLSIVEEGTLVEGQVHIRMGNTEKQIDLSGAVHRIGEAIAGLYEINEKAVENG
ncbi:flagellar biosynthesis protein [Aliiroseovarius crassostreae]|uniref:FliH/SctL family protein n=1 Tax=Aliiroseovarius crassostreae TaxID=154981 RepID=UPI003C7A8787